MSRNPQMVLTGSRIMPLGNDAMTDPGCQVTPKPVPADIQAAVEHVDKLLPADDRTISWGRIADRLDGATLEDLKLIGRHTI